MEPAQPWVLKQQHLVCQGPSSPPPPARAGWILAPLCTLCCWRGAAYLSGSAPAPGAAGLGGREGCATHTRCTPGRGLLVPGTPGCHPARGHRSLQSCFLRQPAGLQPWSTVSWGARRVRALLSARRPPWGYGESPGESVAHTRLSPLRWGVEEHPHLLALHPAWGGSQEPLDSVWWSPIWDQCWRDVFGSPCACFPWGTR